MPPQFIIVVWNQNDNEPHAYIGPFDTKDEAQRQIVEHGEPLPDYLTCQIDVLIPHLTMTPQ